MLDYCPYDFGKLNPNNLPYEISFYGDEGAEHYNWELVEEILDIKHNSLPYVRKMTRRMEFFNFKKSEDAREELLMFLPTARPGGKDGLTLFKELLDRKEKEAEKEVEEAAETDEWAGFEERRLLRHIVENGVDIFVTDRGDRVMRAIPCCPHCYNRLPVGWSEAEDFGAVALMAATGGGKTTFLYSTMNDNWRFLQEALGEGNELRKIHISSAHWNDDAIYNEYVKDAKAMCKRNGLCPNHTNTQKRIAPIFLKIQYEGHCFIMGIYDNAGERLAAMNVNDPRVQMLIDKTFALMFLFDPKKFHIALPQNREEIVRERLGECKMLSVEEQGMLQKEHRNDVIRAKEVLDAWWNIEDVENAGNENEKDPLKVYSSYTEAVKLLPGGLEKLQNKNFFGILIKCDLLEQTEELQNTREYDFLFSRTVDKSYDSTSMRLRNTTTEKMINDFGFFDEYQMKEFRNDFKKDSVFWHCVSALGCDAGESNAQQRGHLNGNYAPIHVADPMAQCIVKFMQEKKFIKNEREK